MLNPNFLAHLRHGAKTALATVFAYLASELMHIPHGFWAAISAVIVMQVNVADSLQMCWRRFTGTAFGAIIGTVTILLTPDSMPFVILSLFLSVGFCAYMTRYNERYRMAAITVVIIFLGSIELHATGIERIYFALHRVLEIGIGVISALTVSLTIWPVHAGKSLEKKLHTEFMAAKDYLVACVEAFLRKQEAVPSHELDNLSRNAAQNRAIFNKALLHERFFLNEDGRLLSCKVTLLNKCIDSLQTMQRLLNEVHEDGWDIIMEPELLRLKEALVHFLEAFAGSQPLPEEDLRAAVEQVDHRFQDLRDQGVTKRFPLMKILQVFGFIHEMMLLARALLDASPERRMG